MMFSFVDALPVAMIDGPSTKTAPRSRLAAEDSRGARLDHIAKPTEIRAARRDQVTDDVGGVE
jgi:hypothetical protein